MIITELVIPGSPITKGSLTRQGDRLVDTPQSKRWRRLMAGAIRDDLARRWPWNVSSTSPELPYTGAVVVHATWWLPVPALQDGAGDLDKLLRNQFDALSAPGPNTTDTSLCASAICDDNQVQGVLSWKFFDSDTPGVLLVVETVSENDLVKIEGAARLHRARLTA